MTYHQLADKRTSLIKRVAAMRGKKGVEALRERLRAITHTMLDIENMNNRARGPFVPVTMNEI